MAIYIPVLKTKATSFRAVRALKDKTKNSIIPLLEIVPDTEIDITKNLILHWQIGTPIYLDFIFLDGAESIAETIQSVIYDCIDNGFNVIPVWGPERTTEYLDGIKSLDNSKVKKIAYRFPESIFSPKNVHSIIDKAFAELNGRFQESHVFLDLEDMSTGQSKYYAAIELLRSLFSPSHSIFGCIAGAFPDAGQLLEYKNSTADIPRYDFELWKQLMESGDSFASNLSYGDYTIRDIELPFSGFTTSIIPTLRYTKEASFYVNRGVSHKKHDRGMHQFNDACHELMQEPFFRGAAFSDGDRLISEKGTELDSSPGNQATWAQIGVNQHIEFVVQQISQISASK